MFLQRLSKIVACISILASASSALTQNVTIIPNSTLGDPSNPHLGRTPFRVLKTNTTRGPGENGSSAGGTAGPDAYAETPASVACFYGITALVPGCPTNGTTALPAGGPSTIAIIDAYNDPNAANDLAVFS